MGNKLIPRVKNILYLKSTIFYDNEYIIDCGQPLFQINVNCLIAKTKKVSLFFYLLTLSIKVSMHLASIQTDKHESFFPKQIQLYKYLCTFSISKKGIRFRRIKNRSFPLAAAAAKSHQSCPTLCNPRESSPPGSPVPGILQARTLEWVAISFSNACK